MASAENYTQSILRCLGLTWQIMPKIDIAITIIILANVYWEIIMCQADSK